MSEFPLTHLRDAAHLGEAHRMIDRLLTENLDSGAQSYLDVLTDLVDAHELEHVPIRDASEADVLLELMRSNGLSQAKLKQVVGIAQSTLSAVLNGERRLTRDQMVTLARFVLSRFACRLPAGLMA